MKKEKFFKVADLVALANGSWKSPSWEEKGAKTLLPEYLIVGTFLQGALEKLVHQENTCFQIFVSLYLQHSLLDRDSCLQVI